MRMLESKDEASAGEEQDGAGLDGETANHHHHHQGNDFPQDCTGVKGNIFFH